MIINVRGTNGSGKTTVVKSLMEMSGPSAVPMTWATQRIHSPTQKDPDRFVDKDVCGDVYELPSGKTLGVLGTYHKKCGGCDEFS